MKGIEINQEFADELDLRLDRHLEETGEDMEFLELSEEEIIKLTGLNWEEVKQSTPYGCMFHYQEIPVVPLDFISSHKGMETYGDDGGLVESIKELRGR